MTQAVLGALLLVGGCSAMWVVRPRKGVAVLTSDALAATVALALTGAISAGLGLLMVELFSL